VLLTMYDARLNLSRQVVADAREYFGPKVFQTIVPRNIRLAEAPSFGKPIILYDIASVGAQSYMSVAREIVQRHAAPEPVPALEHAHVELPPAIS
jgi:chromosome partitioning protein